MSRSKRGGRPDGRPAVTPEVKGRIQDLTDHAIRDVAAKLTPMVLAPALAQEAAELAVGHAMRIIPGLTSALAGGDALAGPREMGGGIVVDSGQGPNAQSSVLLDTSRAILLDAVYVCEVDVATADGPRLSTGDRVFMLQLDGAMAGTRGADRGRAAVLGGLDHLALVLAEVLGLAERAGVFPELWEAIQKALPGKPTPTEGDPR